MAKKSVGLYIIYHLTHNVRRGQLRVWADFYSRIFGFVEQKYFDIKGKATGLFSQAMIAPDRAIRIPLNESQDDKSQIEEFIRDYNGERSEEHTSELQSLMRTSYAGFCMKK